VRESGLVIEDVTNEHAVEIFVGGVRPLAVPAGDS
jgi:hypothetical protein